MSWSPGEAIVFRQVWQGKAWAALPVRVVSDEPGLLVTYVPERAPLGFAPGDFPGGVHPWAHRAHWEGHGTLMLRRPGDPYSIWVFWHGDAREFACWYVNLEQPYRRSAIGIDTLDHELDLWSEDGVTWQLKDEEGVEQRVAEGRARRPVVGSELGGVGAAGRPGHAVLAGRLGARAGRLISGRLSA